MCWVLISFISNLCAPSEYVKVIISQDCSFDPNNTRLFTEKLKELTKSKFQWLKFKVIHDKAQSPSEIVVEYNKGNKNRRILKNIIDETDLQTKAIADIEYELKMLPSPSMGCN